MDPVVEVETQGGWAVATLRDDLDLTTAPRLREQLVGVLTGGQPRLVLDLEPVAFIDSTGLGVLVGVRKRARSLGGDVRLVSTRPALRSLLELTELDRALRLFPTVAAAISPEG
jgi:anti-sigma B factor antagonist